MLSLAMAFRSFRSLFTALLAVLVTASLCLSAALASDMTVKIRIQPIMTSAGPSGDCVHSDSTKAKSAICSMVCSASSIAMLPHASPREVAKIVTIVPLPADEDASGFRPPPERYPPKTL